MDVRIEPTWKDRLSEEFSAPYFTELRNFVRSEYTERTVFPPAKQIFRAFDLAPFDAVRVVILGQDPYHGHGQANGLCFAVGNDIPLPPSLKNIYKEIESDLETEVEKSGDLERWAKQGVLLLNATLTVRAATPGSHQGKGWEQFTDAAIKKLSSDREGIVFMLWGRYAEQKGKVIDPARHLVLSAPHPSPFSAHSGFFGCKHFSKANAYLKQHGAAPVIW